VTKPAKREHRFRRRPQGPGLRAQGWARPQAL
jgi:hypothetical protein